jgi:hypothetical protein
MDKFAVDNGVLVTRGCFVHGEKGRPVWQQSDTDPDILKIQVLLDPV